MYAMPGHATVSLPERLAKSSRRYPNRMYRPRSPTGAPRSAPAGRG